jgi:hypothetical protein
MATLYKSTGASGQSYDGTQWGAGVTHEATGPADGPLRSSSWIRVYEHPLVALLLNPIHENLDSPQLWVCQGEIGKREGPLKCGCRKLTTVEVLPLPTITTEQRIRFAIGCAWPEASATWRDWAANWLAGKDRTAARAAAAWTAMWATALADLNLSVIAEWAVTDQPIEALYPVAVAKDME